MRKFKLLVDTYEKRIIFNALIELRNKQLDKLRPTDAIDELIIKLNK